MGQARPGRRRRAGAGRRAGRLRRQGRHARLADPADLPGLSRHLAPGREGGGRGAGDDGERRGPAGLGRPGGRRQADRLLRLARRLRRPGHGHLHVRVPVERRRGPQPAGPPRAGDGGRLQHVGHGARRLGVLPGRQAAGAGRGGGVGQPDAALRGDRAAAGQGAAGVGHEGHRRAEDAAARQRQLQRLPRLRQVAAEGPAAGAQTARAAPHRGPVQPGAARDAGRRVPRLGRRRAPVGPVGRLALRRPHHRLRVRPGLQQAAAGEPDQVRDVPARLAAAQGDAVGGRAGGDAARAGGVGALRRAPHGPARRGAEGHAGRGVGGDGQVPRGLPRPCLVRPGPVAAGAAAARRRPVGAGPAGVRVPVPPGLAQRDRPGPAQPPATRATGASCWRSTMWAA